MYRAIPHRPTLPEMAQIYAWRLMLYATRHTHRLTTRWAPLLLPILPFLWVPMLALLAGALLGWSLVR